MSFIRKCVTACVFVACSATASAMPTDFTFEIDWFGVFTGTGLVEFTLLGYEGSGTEQFSPGNVDGNQITSFKTSVGDVLFTAEDFDTFPAVPLVTINDGVLGLFESSVARKGDVQLQVGPGFFGYFDPLRGESDGFIREGSFRQVSDTTSSVSTPATLALLALGLTGLGWSRRKKA